MMTTVAEECETGRSTFAMRPAGPREAAYLERGATYQAALAYIDGRIQVEGDFFAAVQWVTAGRSRRTFGQQMLARMLGLIVKSGLQSWIQSRTRARQNIEFHYDHPAEFYRQFLGETLAYSCAYFETPDQSLDSAQRAKLRLICRKLDLQPGERFLDVGCGFGALVAYAAESCGAAATGCTLSRGQAEVANIALNLRRLGSRARVVRTDYRDLPGTFDKIASVGMFEHVGIRRLRGYFTHIHERLSPDGLFLNHGIARPSTVAPGAEAYFLHRHVFPGGQLASLAETIAAAERAGFEALDVENLRPHYAQTCRRWVHALLERQRRCTELVGGRVFRTWVLYLAASALSFEAGQTEVHQVLFAKRSSRIARPWLRRQIYGGTR